MNDKKLFFGALALLVLPLTLAFLGGDKFRYPCQDPDNWEKDFCKMYTFRGKLTERDKVLQLVAEESNPLSKIEIREKGSIKNIEF